MTSKAKVEVPMKPIRTKRNLECFLPKLFQLFSVVRNILLFHLYNSSAGRFVPTTS